MSTETVCLLIPECVLIATALAIYVAGAFVDAPRRWSWVAAGGILLAAGSLWLQSGTVIFEGGGLDGPVSSDGLATFGRWFALAFGGLFVLLSSRPLSGPGTSEYVGSLLLAIAGLMLVSGASELVLLFLGLELISIPTYILLYLGRRDSNSQEATLKYFFLSILASAMLLYGFSFLYGTTGTTDLTAMRAVAVASAGLADLSKVALVLILAGLGFKIAAVPFHFYAPDVYQGTTHTNAAVLSVLPKAAGFIALTRIVVVAMPGMEVHAWRVVLVLAVLTMTFGNVVALWQNNLRRLLAYSSIAHAGYMLIGLAVALASQATGQPMAFGGLGAMLFYLCVYTVATIGTFAVLDYLGDRDKQVESIDELAGLGRTRPVAAAMTAVFMFSLAGIPPLAGFQGKLSIFLSALRVNGQSAGDNLEPWFIGLAIIGVINAAIAAAYYLRIIGTIYFRTPLGTPRAEGGLGSWCAAVACAVLALVIGIYPRPLVRASFAASPAAEYTERETNSQENLSVDR